MTRPTLYSSSRAKAAGTAVPPPVPEKKKNRLRAWLRQNRLPLLAAVPGLAALAFVLLQLAFAPPQVVYTQEDIDAAVTKALETVPVPSHSTRAYEVVRGSIVRVRAYYDGPDGGETEGSVGTGVVILDKGVILTNIHVVAGAKRIGLVFADGMEADAVVTGTRPEDDLAVLQAAAIPDDLQAATLQSTSGLSPGDFVTAVGFPFGIGPSVSSGVVSGLKREYRSPEGKRLLTNLIQFDAAVNPGNSGGPLLNASGEVVGIVTGILNPTEQRVFVGIGFAVPIENAAAAVGVPPF
jgi:S1-C subfamily serine protease